MVLLENIYSSVSLFTICLLYELKSPVWTIIAFIHYVHPGSRTIDFIKIEERKNGCGLADGMLGSVGTDHCFSPLIQDRSLSSKVKSQLGAGNK